MSRLLLPPGPAAVQKELVLLDEAGKRADSWMAARVRLLENVEAEKTPSSRS